MTTLWIIDQLDEFTEGLRGFDTPRGSNEFRHFFRDLSAILRACQNIPYAQDRSGSMLRLILEIRDFAEDLLVQTSIIFDPIIIVPIRQHHFQQILTNVHVLIGKLKTLLLY
jgi:hypothetical protein